MTEYSCHYRIHSGIKGNFAMKTQKRITEKYNGFEQGPGRPPSEADSLLILVSRHCPWNRCTFCPIFNDARFSIRPVSHVKKDIDAVSRHIKTIIAAFGKAGTIDRSKLSAIVTNIEPEDHHAFGAALNWFATGMKSIFLQDANSLVVKPSDLIEILEYLNKNFPWVERTTSYARSHTISRISDNNLKAMRNAGLSRLHIGLESGSDKVLNKVKKGATADIHIKAGLKVKKAGMELSEYIMPGLGGSELSEHHAIETARVLNVINPHFIRIRTLAIPNTAELHNDLQSGKFNKCTDVMIAKEILTFLEHLNGIDSVIKSDHTLNLFQEIEGTFPGDKAAMMQILTDFLAMDPESRVLYQVGRRLGILYGIHDLKQPDNLARIQEFCKENRITPENVDSITDEIVKRFI
jgi:histone acetyltransferase (RNA polymerase elongator complex component)